MACHRTPLVRRGRGFTLIELMIVVAVVAILAALAYPSYLESIRKSRRSEAKNALLDLAVRQERYFTTHNAYAATPLALGYGAAAFPIDVVYGGDAYYQISMTVAAGSTGWSASAVPTSRQNADRCGSYTLDYLGIEDNVGASVPTTQCW
jgi:type IV pilus assembly protein PilE